ncbi:hypothetical protein AMQ84_01420 [Paenibacillus riograndensis]|uniref:Uncharacterized protein n=1 Tax=Paenibacillus riograndensis TaxID=483937 RepID=A0A132UBC9_9BACL|nr:hypothetical protein [Paenibacillus riograndensis]KWX81017.1 hypothetical protein AMQ84_01420 [Paenibacillus riograndensis]
MFNPQFNEDNRRININNKLLIICAILFALLALYNPDKEDFAEYKLNRSGVHEGIKNGFITSFTNLISKPMLASTTERKNKLFYSIFTTADNTKYIGLFKVVFIEF